MTDPARPGPARPGSDRIGPGSQTNRERQRAGVGPPFKILFSFHLHCTRAREQCNMRKRINLTGQRFGRLTVIIEGPPAYPMRKSGYKQITRRWYCECACDATRAYASSSDPLDVGACDAIRVGACDALSDRNPGRDYHLIDQTSLVRGLVKSCGCLHAEMRAGTYKSALTHGLSKHPLNGVWAKMVRRCHDAADPGFYKYGARGIQVCEAWRSNRQAFFDHIGTRPGPGYSVDRIKNDRDYEPGNVRWATRSMQQLNQRRTRTVQFGHWEVPVRQLEYMLDIPKSGLKPWLDTRKNDLSRTLLDLAAKRDREISSKPLASQRMKF